MAIAIQEKERNAKIQDVNLKDLARVHQKPCISVYVGHSAGESATLELKHYGEALKRAEASFGGTPITADEAIQLLESKWHAEQKSNIVPPETRGSAAFFGKDFLELYRLPVSLGEQVAVGSEFFLRPLLPLVVPSDRYFVLALSQKHVRLFQASSQGMKERHLRSVPANLHDDLAGLSFEHRYEMHTAASPASHQKGAVFHGPSVTNKDRLIHFFRDVDHGLANLLKGEQAPLIVAAVEYLFPIYKEANTYPHLLEDMIAGNPDLLSPNALHAASWKIAEKHFAEAGKRAFALYQDHAGTELTSSNLRKIIFAAERGAVRYLFLASTGERWGVFDPPENVHLHATREAGDDELLNLAVVLTIRNGGQVYTVLPSELPVGAEIAALLRF